MKQILHILRKDLRRLWMEELLILSAVFLYIRINWIVTSPEHRQQWYANDGLAVFVLFLLWWFTVVRLVQDEALVGDQQFWITRPYEWPKLLAAKILFFTLVICLPFAIGTLVSTKLAGTVFWSHPAYQYGSLTGEILALTVLFTIPVVAVATITRKISHWLLTLVGIIVCIILLALAHPHLTTSDVASAGDSAEMLEFGSALFLCLVVIIIQYARRKTWSSWLIVGCSIILIPVIMAATPYRRLLEQEFPLISSTHEPVLHASLIDMKEEGEAKELAALTPQDATVQLFFPVDVSDVRKNHIVSLEAISIIVDTPDGFHWQSAWESSSGFFYPYTGSFQLPVSVDRAVYDRVKDNSKTSVRLVLAITELNQTGSHRLVAQKQFDVPDFGRCWLGSLDGQINCRTSGASSNMESMVLASDDYNCPIDERKVNRKALPKGLVAQVLDNTSGDSLGPLHLRSFVLTTWDQYGIPSELHPRVCPGTAITAVSYEKGDHFRLDVGLGELLPADYRRNNSAMFK